MTGTPGHSIKGNISVASGATLNFNPTSAGTFNLNGTSAQTISGSGTLTINSTQTISVSNSVGVTLQRNVATSGPFNVVSGGVLNCGTNVLSGTGTFNLQPGGTLGIGDANGIVAAPTASGNIQNLNRIFNSSANYIYNGSAAQVTGNGLPATLTGALTVNNGAGVTLSRDTTLNGASSIGAGATLNTGVFTLAVGNALTNSGTFNVNGGAFQLNAGGSISGSPTYGSTSLLKYNTGGTYGRAGEWLPGVTSGAGYPRLVQLSGNTTLDLPNGSTGSAFQLAGGLQIDAGSTLNMGAMSQPLTVLDGIQIDGTLVLSTVSGGDLKVGGLWVRNAATGTFTPNGRAVFFNGSSGFPHTIDVLGGGTETFNYLVVNNPSGIATGDFFGVTNVAVNGTSGDVLQLLGGGLALSNGSTLVLSGNGGNLLASGGARAVLGPGGGSGSVSFNGSKTVASASGGTLSFASNVTVNLSAGVDFGPGLSTVNGTLSLKSGGFVNTNPPTYASGSTLEYDNGATYNAAAEFPATGVQNVTLSSTTQLNLNGNKTVSGTVALGANKIDAGANTLALGGSAAVTRTTGYINGNLEKTYLSAGSHAFTYPVGTANGYSPVDAAVTINSAGTNTLTVKAVQGQQPSISGANALQRYWTLSNSFVGGGSADLTFNYLAGDVAGTESNYKVVKVTSGGVITQFTPDALNTTSHFATLNGVSSFSDWTLAEPSAVQPGSLQFSSATYGDAETNSDHTFNVTVTRTGGSDGAVSIDYFVQDGSANFGSDYTVTPSTGTLNWAAGDASSKTIVVTVIGDTNAEPAESFTLNIFNPQGGASQGAPDSATFTITDDDPFPPTLGGYGDATVPLGGNTTVTPLAAPTNATSVTVSTSTNFKGLLTVDPSTGVVRVTNAQPAGSHAVTVKAAGAGGSTSTTFTLTVQSGTACAYPPSFTSAPDLAVGSSPLHTAVGDFNNDGKQDLLVSNQNSHNVSVRLGDGAGNFTGAADVPASQSPRWIAVGDFNGDGKQDFAVANNTSSSPFSVPNTVAVRLGVGDGTFTSAADISLGILFSPWALAAGDFNGDGRQDLAVTSFNNSTVDVRLGAGDGTFTPAGTVAVGGDPTPTNNRPTSIAVGDFNGDGKQDLAVGNRNSLTVSVRLGTGTGAFTGTTEVSTDPSATLLQWVAVSDFDGDAKQDLAIGNNNGTVSVRPGDGAGNFSGATNVTLGTSFGGIAVGDLDNDGNGDLLGVGTVAGGSGYARGDGAAGFGVRVGVTGTGSSVALGDFNGNGILDYATSNGHVRLGTCQASVLEFSPASYSVGEGGGSVVLTVARTGSSAGAVALSYVTADFTAAAGSDYTPLSDGLVWADGDTSAKTITVPVSDDAVYEGDESFYVLLSAPSNATLGAQQSALVTINENDPLPSLSVGDVTVAEPSSGITYAVFPVTLSGPSAQTVAANYSTADGTATQPGDYASTGGLLSFAPGETSKTVAVVVKADALSDTPETFSLFLFQHSNATLADGTGVATITAPVGAGTVLISEFRLRGPGDPNAAPVDADTPVIMGRSPRKGGGRPVADTNESGEPNPAATPPVVIVGGDDGGGPNAPPETDEFIEVYNNTDSDITVTDPNPVTCAAQVVTLGLDPQQACGWALVDLQGSVSGIPRFVIPVGTVIPARGHFLAASTGYSLSALAAPDLTYSPPAYGGGEADYTGLALFRTADRAQFTQSNVFDAVGFDGVAAPFREGSGLLPLAGVGEDVQFSFVRNQTSSRPGDTGDNRADFTLVATTPSLLLSGVATLGAPGPENLQGLVSKNSGFAVTIPPNVASSLRSNTTVTNGSLGTLSLRRRFTNNTGQALSRLRFRVVNVTTYQSKQIFANQAEMRLLDAQLTGLGGTGLLATSVETPPAQTSGGGVNSGLLVSGSLTLAQPLAAGASVDVEFLLGVMKGGSYQFVVVIEGGQ